MSRSLLVSRFARCCLLCLALHRESPATACPAFEDRPIRDGKAAPEATLRMDVSNTEGLSSVVGLSAGATRWYLGLRCMPNSVPEFLFGATGPLAVAGPVRRAGILRLLSSPCTDAYLFTGAWHRPLALDLESARYGFFLGESAGIWILDSEAPGMGLWAGTLGDTGPLLGGAVSGSILPAEDDPEAWFSDEPGRPRRLMAAGMLWAGYGYPHGKIMAAAAYSEEDCGENGWAARAEGEYRRGKIRWDGSFSLASSGWRGLSGEEAERWKVRTDASWLLSSRVRLEGRVLAGADDAGRVDWEVRARIVRNGRAWNFRAALEGTDSAGSLPVRLKPDMEAEYAGGSFRLSARSACGIEEGAPVLAECSAALSLGAVRQPRFRLEGWYRRTADDVCWKGCARLEAPTASGLFTVSAGTDDWSTGSERPEWEFRFDLRVRFP